LIVALLTFYTRIVKFLTKVDEKLERHSKILVAPSGDLNVVTHEVFRQICAACPNKTAIKALQEDVKQLKEGK
jgi:uncharacterized protein YoxC